MHPPDQWQSLTHPAPAHLHETLINLHHAGQLVALTGNSLIPKRPDDSQSNLGWVMDLHWLLGHPITCGTQPLHMALDTHTFRLLVTDEMHNILAQYNLVGKTSAEGLDWIRVVLPQFGISADQIQPITHYALPPHPISDGAAFDPDPEALNELTSHRHNAEIILSSYTSKFPTASSIRVWPHHFDSGSYIPVGQDENGNDNLSLSLGLAIPDELFSEGYYYITTWSKDGNIDYSSLPELSAGEWNTQSWTGAVLRASEIAALSGPMQLRLTQDFFDSGIRAALKLLGKEDLFTS